MKKKRFRVQITFSGKLFFVLSLAIGGAALNTGNNLLYLVFGSMLSFLVLSGILSNNTLSHLDIYAHSDEAIFAEEETNLHLDFKNKKRFLPSFALTCFPKNASSQLNLFHPIFEEKIPARGEKKSAITLAFKNRGFQALPDFQIETQYPFGLLKKYIVLEPQKSLLVFPKVYKIQPIENNGVLHNGSIQLSEKSFTFSNPYGVREFKDGDSTRHIHWKTSAKRDHLFIKEFEGELKPYLFLHLVISSDLTNINLIEKTISAAASLLVHFINLGYVVELCTDQTSLEGVDRPTLNAGLSKLALTDPSKNAFVTEFSRKKPMIVISDQSICQGAPEDAQVLTASMIGIQL